MKRSVAHLVSMRAGVWTLRVPKKRARRPADRCVSMTLVLVDCQVMKRRRKAQVTGSQAQRTGETVSKKLAGSVVMVREGAEKSLPAVVVSLPKGMRPMRKPTAAKMGRK